VGELNAHNISQFYISPLKPPACALIRDFPIRCLKFCSSDHKWHRLFTGTLHSYRTRHKLLDRTVFVHRLLTFPLLSSVTAIDVDMDGCPNTICGHNAECRDLPAPATNGTCVCSSGYTGNPLIGCTGAYPAMFTKSSFHSVLLTLHFLAANFPLGTCFYLLSAFTDAVVPPLDCLRHYSLALKSSRVCPKYHAYVRSSRLCRLGWLFS
jgi:hypothetical protein